MDVIKINELDEPNIIYSTPNEIQAIEIDLKETHGLQQKRIKLSDCVIAHNFD